MSRGPLIAQGGGKTERNSAQGVSWWRRLLSSVPAHLLFPPVGVPTLLYQLPTEACRKGKPTFHRIPTSLLPPFLLFPLATPLHRDNSDWTISSQAFQNLGIVKRGSIHSTLRPRMEHHKFKASLSYISSFCLKQRKLVSQHVFQNIEMRGARISGRRQ